MATKPKVREMRSLTAEAVLGDIRVDVSTITGEVYISPAGGATEFAVRNTFSASVEYIDSIIACLQSVKTALADEEANGRG